MNRLFQLLCIFFLGSLFSCNETRNAKIESLNFIGKTDSCQTNPNHKYEIFFPEKSQEAKLPLLVIIDAHGSGKFALNKFKPAADRYPAILVASNYVKNGFENYTEEIQTLITDVRQKYRANETVFLTGFSGGARMALGYALSHNVNGLILCGALANADEINSVNCPVISISGMDDFNFIETAQYLFQEQSIPANLKIELTNASHDWPDSLMLANAFGFLQLSKSGAENSVTKSVLKNYNQNQLARIDSLVKTEDYLKAVQVARNLATTKPFSEENAFSVTYNELKSDQKYVSQLNQLKNNFNIEIKARQPYIDAFTTKDSLWWKNEIESINRKMATEKNQYTIDMYHRINGFWGIACYSLGNQAIKAKDLKTLENINFVYRTLEPENPYVYYFSAFPYFWEGENDATIAMLKKAIDHGFTEIDQLKQDFPEIILSRVIE